MTLEIVLIWAAVTLYAASAVLFVTGFVFRSERVIALGGWSAVAGLLPHAVAIGVRWVRVGHGPGLGFFEVASSLAFMSVLIGVILVWRDRRLAPAGAILMPVAFLMLGGSLLAPQSGMDVTATLASWWLTIHIAFAKLAYGCFIAAFALAGIYLLRLRLAPERWSALFDKMPPQEALDDLAYKLVAVGFVFLGTMIAAGAVWANEAWGRYWAWDPIETWSLIAWIVYAVVLHLRLTMGWRGTRFAWATMLALPVVVFALVGVPIAYSSIHAAYLTGVETAPK